MNNRKKIIAALNKHYSIEREKAIEILYKQEWRNKQIKKMLIKQGCQTKEAEDVIQKTFEVLLRYSKDIAQPNAFLKRTARNIFLNTLKKTKIKITLTDYQDEINLPTSPSFSIEILDLPSDSEIVMKLLPDLTQRCKEVLQLKFFKGLKMKQLEEALHFSNNFGKKEVYRCLQSFRKKLQHEPLLSSKRKQWLENKLNPSKKTK